MEKNLNPRNQNVNPESNSDHFFENLNLKIENTPTPNKASPKFNTPKNSNSNLNYKIVSRDSELKNPLDLKPYSEKKIIIKSSRSNKKTTAIFYGITPKVKKLKKY